MGGLTRNAFLSIQPHHASWGLLSKPSFTDTLMKLCLSCNSPQHVYLYMHIPHEVFEDTAFKMTLQQSTLFHCDKKKKMLQVQDYGFKVRKGR